MNPGYFLRFCATALVIGILSACSSGGDGEPAAACDGDGSGSIALSGTILFEDVPAQTGSNGATFLDYDNTVQKPVREAQLRVECADGSTTFIRSTTDTDGNYSVDVPQNVDARLVVRATSTRDDGPSWDFEVVDNTNNQAVWALEGERFNTGDSDLDVDLVATSGWGGSFYTDERIAGAFSVYDTVYEAMQLVISADPDAAFAQLTLNWSPNNTSACDGNIPDGCIGTSFYSGGEIYILGEENEDTDEYDDSVVAHEWGHYYEDVFSRSDSIGGSHSGGEALDIRVAFSEGWGNAVSGMILDETVYRDTLGSSQSNGFTIGLESETTADPGWWNEASVQLILFDLFDDVDDGQDTLSLGFTPIHEVFNGPQRTTEAFTSIFSFIHYLVDDGHADPAQVSNLLADNGISPISDVWGSNRTFDAAPPGLDTDYTAPVYLDLADTVNPPRNSEDICVTNATGEYNKLGNRRFGRFTAATSGIYELSLDGDSVPDALPGSDPDFYIFRSGNLVLNASADSSATGVETGEVSLSGGVSYVIDMHEWLNIDQDENTGGEVCLELTATGP